MNYRDYYCCFVVEIHSSSSSSSRYYCSVTFLYSYNYCSHWRRPYPFLCLDSSSLLMEIHSSSFHCSYSYHSRTYLAYQMVYQNRDGSSRYNYYPLWYHFPSSYCHSYLPTDDSSLCFHQSHYCSHSYSPSSFRRYYYCSKPSYS